MVSSLHDYLFEIVVGFVASPGDTKGQIKREHEFSVTRIEAERKK